MSKGKERLTPKLTTFRRCDFPGCSNEREGTEMLQTEISGAIEGHEGDETWDFCEEHASIAADALRGAMKGL